MKQLLVFLAIFVGLQIRADEGMWPIHAFHSKKPTFPFSFYSESASSLKDAVVSVGEGGSGCFISKTGLVLTNMHVIRSLVMKNGKMGHVVENGFCASSKIPELELKNLYLKILVRTIDVSAEVTQELSKGQNWKHLEKDICLRYKPLQADNTQEIKREFYGANHFLHEYTVIRDVRLVYSPPLSMASYGGNAVNWLWPRMSADFAILRAYAKSKAGKSHPFVPKCYLRRSKRRIGANENVYVLGFPRGASYNWISADANESILLSLIRRAEVFGLRMSIIGNNLQYLSSDHRALWEGNVSSLNNERLKILGRVTGVLRNTIQEKLLARENSCGLLLCKIDTEKYRVFCDLRNKADSLIRLIAPLIEFDDDYRYCIQVMQLINSAGLVKNKNKFSPHSLDILIDRIFRTPDELMEKSLTKGLLNYLNNKNSIFIPKEIKKGLMGEGDYVDSLYRCSSLVQRDTVKSILLSNRLANNDPAIEYLEYTDSIYMSNVGTSLVSYTEQLNEVREKILIILHDCGLIRWPSTNGTLRVSYGKTGTQCWSTYLNREICKAWANYGYKLRHDDSIDKQVFVNFTTNCHTTSGNSGSPVINEHGELVGINFDRVIDSLCGDYYYLSSVCQNICVGIDYIIQILQSRKDSKLILEEL